jgi:hypothetical protein
MPLTLQTIYLGAAVAGGFLLLVQLALALLGGDGDADVDGPDAEHPEGHGISFRTVVAFVTFFGIGGMAARGFGAGAWSGLLIALACGALAFWLVGLAMLQLSRLRSSGNVDPRNAIGAQAKVYLTIPGLDGGDGRVTVPVQGRSMQFRAVTRGPQIPTGRFCKVVGVRGEDTLEVEPL